MAVNSIKDSSASDTIDQAEISAMLSIESEESEDTVVRGDHNMGEDSCIMPVSSVLFAG
jgi:hypothetical protein